MTRRWLLRILTSGAFVGLTGCSLIERTDHIRYRITVDIDTPAGLRSGSSVWEVSMRDAWLSSPHGIAASGWSGQAVSIKMPNGKILFALLRGDQGGDYPIDLISHRLSVAAPGEDWRVSWKRLFPEWKKSQPRFVIQHWIPSTSVGQNPADPPRSGYPKFAYFKDFQIGSTATFITPDDLQSTFGAGYKIRRISIKITDSDVGMNLRGFLPVPGDGGFYDWDGKSPISENNVSIGDFVARHPT